MMLSQFVPSVSRPFAAALLAAGLFATPALAQAEIAESTTPKLDVPFVPTPDDIVDHMLGVANVTADDFVIDLGSGDGRILIAAARDRGARGFGVDLDPQRVNEARNNAEAAGVSDMVEFKQQDLFDTDFSHADVLTMYLLPRFNLQLRPRILDELRPGTRVVSHDFDMAEWAPDRDDTLGYKRVFLWIVPAKVEGRWTIEADGRSFDVDITQKFQMIEGTANVDGREVLLTGATLNGPDISFTVDLGDGARTLEGSVDGDRIEGAGGWQATRG